MKLTTAPMRPQEAEIIASWRYDSPYDIYSLTQDHVAVLLDPSNRYYCMRDRANQIVGYCCFGAEARVAGGDFEVVEPEVLDIGVGMAPTLIGRGLGKDFVGAVLEYALDAFGPQRLRVSIADFNTRSRRTFEALGFKESGHFARESDGMQFIQLERAAVQTE